jgi:hypothetical protein
MTESRRGDETVRRPARDQALTEDDLRATGDAIRSDIARLDALEAAKEELDPEDPTLDRISDEAVDLASRIATETRVERQLGRDLAQD